MVRQRRNSPPRRGGVARSAGVVSSAKRFGRSSIKASPYRARASRHPVCAASPLAVGAATPPGEEGNNAL